MTTNTPTNPDHIRDTVREGYAKIAQSGSWSAAQSGSSACCAPNARATHAGATSGGGDPSGGGGGACCGPVAVSAEQLAEQIGYDPTELAAIPEGANMGLSCGNPGAIASLKHGEVVLDLGSGGGFDCFLASPKVGPTGRVIGVDMTPDMLSKARRNIESHLRQSGLDNVEFRLGEIEHLPVADNSVDVVLSNCVLNLSPDKPRVWREIARVLKPGGRVAISDLALRKPLPEHVAEMVEALIGCIAGAALIDDTRRMIEDAGLTDITLEPSETYIDSLTSAGDPLMQRIVESMPDGASPSDYVVSLAISARKRE